MTRLWIAAVAALSLAGAAIAATPALPGGSASVTASSARAAARPVALTFRLHYEMQCGYVGGPITLHLPAAMTAPATIAKSAVRLDARRPVSVGTHGRTVVVGVPPRPQIMCDEIAMGTATVVLTRAAGIGNPPKTGLYAFPIEVGALHTAAILKITR